MVKVLFICMGNICRSPTAEGVFRHAVNQAGLTDQIFIDSAGTHAYHVGNPPDQRAQAAAIKRKIDLSSQRARKVEATDFAEFDYVIPMDHSNYSDLQYICPKEHENRISLFLDFANNSNEQEVPDPYYGEGQGFENVLDLVEDAANGLLTSIKDKHGI